jgi:disulfide bond formation protein DsbB
MNKRLAFAETRTAWLTLAASAMGLEVSALWFQYGMRLDPCVMCVYERLAVIGLMLAGLLGALAPRLTIVRWSGYLIWAVSAGWGLLLAIEHVGYQTDTSGALSCSFLPNFPAWLPLEQWLPSVFLPTGYCDDVQWQWLSLTMAEWMVVVFTIYLLILGAVLVMGGVQHTQG